MTGAIGPEVGLFPVVAAVASSLPCLLYSLFILGGIWFEAFNTVLNHQTISAVKWPSVAFYSIRAGGVSASALLSIRGAVLQKLSLLHTSFMANFALIFLLASHHLIAQTRWFAFCFSVFEMHSSRGTTTSLSVLLLVMNYSVAHLLYKLMKAQTYEGLLIRKHGLKKKF